MDTNLKALLIILFGVIAFVGLDYVMNDGRHYKDRERMGIQNFEECVAKGNPTTDTYPRECVHNGHKYFYEDAVDNEPPPTSDNSNQNNDVGVIECNPNNRPEACTQQYDPVCGLVEVQCITTPCDPVPQTYGNGCEACAAFNVVSYTRGECEL